jgi:hypothetical protein
VGQPHEIIECELPRGNRLDRSLMVLQQRGEISRSIALVF